MTYTATDLHAYFRRYTTTPQAAQTSVRVLALLREAMELMEGIPDEELQDGSPPHVAMDGIYDAIGMLTPFEDEDGDEPSEPAPRPSLRLVVG